MYQFKSQEFNKWVNTSDETRIFDNLSNITIQDNATISSIMTWYNSKTNNNQGVMNNQSHTMMGGGGWCWGLGCNKKSTTPMTTPMYIIPPDDNNSLFDILNHYSREIITNPDILLFLCIFFSPLHQQPLLMDRIGMLDSINTDISRFINGYIDVLRHHLSNTDGVNIITASYIFCNSPFLKILIDNEIPIFAPKSIYSYLPGIILSLYIDDPYLTDQMANTINYIGTQGGRSNPYRIYEIYAINCIIKINNPLHPSYGILHNMISRINIPTNIYINRTNGSSIVIHLASMYVDIDIINIPLAILFCGVGHHWDANKDIQQLLISKYSGYIEISYRIFINNYITKHYPRGAPDVKLVIISRFRNILDGIRIGDDRINTDKLYKSITDVVKVFIGTTISNTSIADPDYDNNLTIIVTFINMIYQVYPPGVDDIIYSIWWSVAHPHTIAFYQFKYATYIISDYANSLSISEPEKYYDAIYDIIADIYTNSNIYNNDIYRLNQLESILNGIGGHHISILGNRLERLIVNEYGILQYIGNTPEFINAVRDIIQFKFGIHDKNISQPHYSNSSLLSSIVYSNDGYYNTPISPLVFSNPSSGSYHTNSSS